MKILAINPGSTSTKIALFSGRKKLIQDDIKHKQVEIKQFESIAAQEELRYNYIMDFLSRAEIKPRELTAVAGRGGVLKPVPGGTYTVNEQMLADLKSGSRGEHASNLGGILAHRVALTAGCTAYIVDPVVVDEMEPVARLSGIPELQRRSIFHALNQKAVARKYARNCDRNYQELNLIIAHLGGGISVALHHQGRVVDVNNALSGEGPYTPNRSGGLPSLDLLQLCYSGEYSQQKLRDRLKGEGGIKAYLGTDDMLEVEERARTGEHRAELIYKGLIYQVSKEIGSLAPVVKGRVDGIILTGGIAHSEYVTGQIKESLEWLAPVIIYPGEEEMTALVEGVLRVLNGEEKPLSYN